MIDPRRGEEHRLACRAETRGSAGKEHLSQGFCLWRAAGLTRRDDLDAALFETRDEQPDLRRLAGPLSAFQSDEPPPARSAEPAVRLTAHLSFLDTYLRNRIVAYSSPASSARCGSEPTGDGISGCHRQVQRQRLAARNLEPPDFHSLRHRCDERAVIDDATTQFLTRAARHQDFHRTACEKRDLAAFAAINLGAADRLARDEDCFGLESPEPPLQDFAGFLAAFFSCLAAADHDDRAAARSARPSRQARNLNPR